MSVLLVSKTDEWSMKAQQLAQAVFPDDLRVFAGTRADPVPADLSRPHQHAIILSFLSPWIIPRAALEQAGLAVNFHCGSTDYPGIGSYNFALYENAKEFGAICHHMEPKVDTGAIVAEHRFPIFESDTVEVLKLRTMAVMLGQFAGIVCRIAKGDRLHADPSLKWTRRPFTRKELELLTVITPAMSADEIARRVRATTYPGAGGPKVTLGGVEFRSPVPDRAPLA